MAKRCKTITYSTCPPTGTCQACKEIVRAECVKYYGDPLDCIEIESGDNLENILEKINTRVCESPSGNSGDIITMINAMSEADLENLTGEEKIPTNAGYIDLSTFVTIVLDGLEIPPYFPYDGVVVISEDGDWLPEYKNKLIAIETGVTLSMPAVDVFEFKDMVHVITQKIGSGDSGKFQLKNGDLYACNFFKDDALDRFEITSLFWSNSESRLVPIISTYHEDTDGLLKTTAKYFYDRTKYNELVGTTTLVGGTVTVNTSFVTTGSVIQVSCITPGGTQGFLSAPSASIVNGVSFVINSSEAADTSTILYKIIKI